uniref:Basic leucine zipper transcriptional factor ATF-like 3 isoform X2 n=1 Tax=Callorhinus ursinus TaxID=34884 RepID=A0A3Q7PUC7_CALUR|nr:basic leucine zipper transcriptional factor ATF-like 3 isoform X2 [Callorhinus ursinus]
MGPGNNTPLAPPKPPTVSLSLKFPESGRRTPKAVLRLLEPLAAPASPLLWGLRVPSRVSEPPRDFHEAQGPRKAAAGVGFGTPRAQRMMTGRSEGEKKTELLLREVGRSRPRRLTNSTSVRSPR